MSRKFNELFDDTKYFDNIEAVRRSNLSFYILFNWVMIFLLSCLFASTLLSSYARSMQLVYVLFIICSILELLAIKFNRLKDNAWVMPMCYFGVVKAYGFCLLSSVFYNQDAPTITFFVFIILVPVCFTFRVREMLLMQALAVLFFFGSVIAVKNEAFVLSDCMNCLIFTLISIIMAMRSTIMRVENFDLYRREDVLEKSNQKIFNTTPCGILELKITGMKVEVLFANKMAINMCGYSAEDFWAKEDWDLSNIVFPDDVPLVVNSFRGTYTGNTQTFDFRLKNEEENKYHWISCKFVVTDVSDDSVTVLTNFLDIDEKKKTESESEAKSRFLSRMSHEIRTPINAIMGISELVRQELAGKRINPKVLNEYADETTEASKYLLTLVNDVLDTSRIENDKIELKQEIVYAEKYLRDVVSLVKPLADNKNIVFSYVRETHLHDAYIGDGVRVQQILVNVLNNAIKFTPNGGTVTFKASGMQEPDNKTRLKFVVTDTGIGMTNEFQAKLFQPFAQEDSGTTSPFEGTGLGLNIAKALAMKMDGDITCSSKPGVGTTFTITIVVKNATAEQLEKAKNKTSNMSTTDQWDFTDIRVLLCEDHPMNQKITRQLLMRHNCIVEVAGDGAEGIRMFENHPEGYYDMILMDIRMPIMDGLAATRKIRELDSPNGREIPIIAMSANAFAEDIAESLSAGMNGHLAKPVDTNLLYNTVAEFTGRKTKDQLDVRKHTVLVVDDIEMNAAIIANIIKHDYEVEIAGNGREAMEILNSNTDIIAVITDLQMPEMDGYELIKTIRANYEYDSVAILANTQYDAKGQTDEILSLGADDFVYKASSPNVLANRLRNVLARRETGNY